MEAKQFIESGILETYAMGLASEQEAKQVAEMVARYPEVKAELSAIEISLENFDRKNAVEPPAHLKSKILSDIGNVSGFRFPVSGDGETDSKVISIASGKQSNFFKYAAAVALILLMVSAWYNYRLSDRVKQAEHEYGDMMVLYNSAKKEWRYYDSLNLELNSELALLKKPGMKAIELMGMEVAPDAKAMVYANTATGDSYLEIMNLPAAPEGMQYQFWGIVDGKPVDAGMIPLSDTTGIHPMKTVPNAVAYAISLEPKGGSQQPQGKIYVMGNS